jgi:hypothetical protein
MDHPGKRITVACDTLVTAEIWPLSRQAEQQGTLLMTAPPFNISPDATDWICRCFDYADRQQHARGLVPALVPCSKRVIRNALGEIVASYSGEFLSLGWYPPETFARLNFHEFSILGRVIFVSPEAMDCLDGKQLVLEPVNADNSNDPTNARLVLTYR